jgi:hypothetical protein
LLKTRVSVQRKNGFVYLRLFASTDDNFQEIGKVFAGTEKAVPNLSGKQLLKKIAAHGPFIHSPGDNLVTVPATTAEVILASKQIS